ncbi:FAD-dependent oxidoreductase [Calidifontibacillus oryziterrae]|uniref:FAD-dependent oxidoreductase n=1 Tax=Calidifontibacillus oryziterrae TaxID=1191699 RepID=UPI0002DC1B74|nr:FAD-dependent oxidoreductase [Calidifontibacillus oryziterrae]
MGNIEIVLYSSTGCPYCEKVKTFLKDWGFPYEERNVSINKEYFDQLQAKKIFGTPATFINGKLALGFQEKKLKKLLGLDEDATPAIIANENQLEVNHHSNERELFQAVTNNILDEVFDFVAIGAGPAGASAAVYGARGKLKTLVIDKAPKAGTLAVTHKIANYPGVKEELTGLELLTRMQEQARDFGARFVRSTVLSVDFSDEEVKKIQVAEGTIKAKSVFIGVGAKAPSGKISGEEEFTGRGVSYCSTCDAAFYQDRIVAVVGDNEEAVHEAETLSKFCSEVKVLIPTNSLKGEVSLDELEQKANVKIYKKYRLKEITGTDAVENIIVLDDQKKEQTWAVDGVFIYLGGIKPGTDFLGTAVDRDEDGYINVDENMRTNVEGVFAGGDARRTPIKQAILSAADGAIAAMSADQYVNNRSKVRPQYS